MMLRAVVTAACATWVLAFAFLTHAAQPQEPLAGPHGSVTFETSANCFACHNGLTTPAGEDISIGVAWRASMMANSSRDPYWQAAVRRETVDHPRKAATIEDGCAICHMPMSRTAARAAGRPGEVFSLLPASRGTSSGHRLAADGVSCTLCHQIGADRLGTRESFAGGFVIPPGPPRMFGPFEVDAGRAAIMHSATGATPTASEHMRESELCATCHTVYTDAIGPRGEVVGSLPEQMPFLEWRHSAYRQERGCPSCHMPLVESTPMASVLGDPRDHVARHSFLGGNFFVLRMLNRYREELAVEALPHELDAAAQATIRQLQAETAAVNIASAHTDDGHVVIEVLVRNLTGHKLPTGYPSRRAWLRATVRDRQGGVIFESGGVTTSGSIRGNDNDTDPWRYEPHYREIRRADQVQIYESIMGDVQGMVTTGLLQATHFLKDNRLLPRGFEKATAARDIAVIGAATDDTDFDGSGDRVRYVLDVTGAAGPFDVEVELLFQPIAARWVENLRPYAAPEPQRFVSYFHAMAPSSWIVLARSTTVVP